MKWLVGDQTCFSTEEQFEDLYMHAVKEPHNALVIDTRPTTANENRIKKNFDIVVSLNVNEPALNHRLMILYNMDQFTLLDLLSREYTR